MCNDYRYRKPIERLIEEFREVKIPLRFPSGIPNWGGAEDIRITDKAPVLRSHEDGARLDMMRWSWPSPSGKPVFNFVSENRRFAPEVRAIVPADGFYEFTVADDPKAKRKDKWLFTPTWGDDLFGIAAIWRLQAAKGEDAWSMLTTAPGSDLEPFHDRQIVILRPDQWRGWLIGEAEGGFLTSLPAGSLKAEKVALS